MGKPYKAVVIVSVADLIGKPLFTQPKANMYNLPISGVDHNGYSRIHQLIFNEIVTVLEKLGNQIRISIPNLFFEQANNQTRYTEYWTHKSAVASIDDLAKQHIPKSMFPEPISFKKNKNGIPIQPIVTLLFPHYDSLTRQTYSAGTRFVVADGVKKNKIFVYAYSPKHHKVCKINLPQHLCLQEHPDTRKKKITLFTSLVQQWSELQSGFVPYVFGGCSFTATCITNNYIKKENAYYRPTYQCSPTPGFDCTGIIARAAQIFDIPYHFKNSTTLVKHLRSLTAQESIENSDIIWFPGHALIIVDTTTHTCVEARSYNHGFGKIHALPINKLFANIHSLEDIKEAMLHNKPISRLDSKGNNVQTVPIIKILKLASAWLDQEKKHKG